MRLVNIHVQANKTEYSALPLSRGIFNHKKSSSLLFKVLREKKLQSHLKSNQSECEDVQERKERKNCLKCFQVLCFSFKFLSSSMASGLFWGCFFCQTCTVVVVLFGLRSQQVSNWLEDCEDSLDGGRIRRRGKKRQHFENTFSTSEP